jgi:hypothetical protein
MQDLQGASRSSAPQPSYEWSDFSYLEPQRSHRDAIVAGVLALWIAILDLCLRSSFAPLYVAPLILMARSGDTRTLWRATGVLIALTYGVFILKNIVNPPPVEWSHFDVRFLNRTFVVIVVLGLTTMLQSWIRWSHEQSDPELPDSVRSQDQEIGTTLAVLISAPIVLLIGIIDFVAPATYNMPILYSIPLFFCAWTRSRRLLWSMFAALSALSVIAFVWGRPPDQIFPNFGLERNRLLAIASMIAVTVALHYWLGRDEEDAARFGTACRR